MDDTERPFESVRRFENLDDADFNSDEASSFDAADDTTTTGCLRRVDETRRRRFSTHLVFVLVVVIARMDGWIDSSQLDCAA